MKDELTLMKGIYDYDIRGSNCKNEDIKKGKKLMMIKREFIMWRGKHETNEIIIIKQWSKI